MLILTGDVHHMTLRTQDQSYLRQTEPRSALAYMEIAERYQIATTLFITGRVVVEESGVMEELSRFSHLEIGGHTYNAYQPLLMHRLSKKLLGQFMGPRDTQRWSIRHTCELLQRYTKERIVSWRDHAYLSDKNTVPLLCEEGLLCFSDVVEAGIQPFSQDGLLYVPINVVPDHEHLYHAHRDKAYVDAWARKTHFRDSWGSGSFTPERWAEMVVDQTRALVEEGKVACLLIHPACMEALDQFETFSWIMKQLADLPSGLMRDLL